MQPRSLHTKSYTNADGFLPQSGQSRPKPPAFGLFQGKNKFSLIAKKQVIGKLSRLKNEREELRMARGTVLRTKRTTVFVGKL